jgi:hypothetical protein
MPPNMGKGGRGTNPRNIRTEIGLITIKIMPSLPFISLRYT